MIAIYRANAIVWRYLYLFRRSFDRLSDAIYWPIMDIVIWGLTTRWLISQGGDASPVLLIMLTAIVFWQIVWRANYEISVNLLEEFWNQNLVNLFSSPLRLREWIAGVMLVGAVKTSATIAVGLAASWALYAMNIFAVGHLFIPFLLSLIVFGWVMGFFAAGLIMYFGPRVQFLAWTMGYLAAPFSAVYYPLEVLPEWAQIIARCLPTTYVFEGMRKVLNHQTLAGYELLISFVLNAIYLSLAIGFFCRMFEKSRKKGLARLE